MDGYMLGSVAFVQKLLFLRFVESVQDAKQHLQALESLKLFLLQNGPLTKLLLLKP